jgi:DNA repair photolyase
MKEGNMYKWVSGTKNPLAGRCLHGCSYCSTNSLMRYPVIAEKYSGEIRLDQKVLSSNPGKDKTWFIVGQNDLFANGVNSEFIHEILEWCRKHDNTYLFQTKNPERFIAFADLFPKNTILCTTIETNRRYPQMGNAPDPLDRAIAMNQMANEGFKIFLTCEPIMDFDLDDMVYLIETCLPTQVNVGADSKNNHLPEPTKINLLALIDRIQKFTTIANKSNLERLLK